MSKKDSNVESKAGNTPILDSCWWGTHKWLRAFFFRSTVLTLSIFLALDLFLFLLPFALHKGQDYYTGITHIHNRTAVSHMYICHSNIATPQYDIHMTVTWCYITNTTVTWQSHDLLFESHVTSRDCHVTIMWMWTHNIYHYDNTLWPPNQLHHSSVQDIPIFDLEWTWI